MSRRYQALMFRLYECRHVLTLIGVVLFGYGVMLATYRWNQDSYIFFRRAAAAIPFDVYIDSNSTRLGGWVINEGRQPHKAVVVFGDRNQASMNGSTAPAGKPNALSAPLWCFLIASLRAILAPSPNNMCAMTHGRWWPGHAPNTRMWRSWGWDWERLLPLKRPKTRRWAACGWRLPLTAGRRWLPTPCRGCCRSGPARILMTVCKRPNAPPSLFMSCGRTTIR